MVSIILFGIVCVFMAIAGVVTFHINRKIRKLDWLDFGLFVIYCVYVGGVGIVFVLKCLSDPFCVP
jgi:hypothetical protein